MGTTMTAMLIVGTTASVAHAGDSRCYLYRPSEGLSQVTEDHSMIAALIAAGGAQPDEVYTHPLRHLIYRSLGQKPAVEVEGYQVQLAAGDTFLLCSDGLWDMVRDQQIRAILARPLPDPAATARALVQVALVAGGDDNVSVIVVRVCQS